MKKKSKLIKILFSCLGIGNLVAIPFLSTSCKKPGVMPDQGWKFAWKTLLDRESINKDWFDSSTNTWTISYGQFQQYGSSDKDTRIDFEINPIISFSYITSIKINGIPDELKDDFIIRPGHIYLKDEIHYKTWESFSFNISINFFDDYTNCYGYVTSDTINVNPQSEYRSVDWTSVSNWRAKISVGDEFYLVDSSSLPYAWDQNTVTIPSNWTLLYDNSFNENEYFYSDAILCDGGMLHKDQYADYFHNDLWTHPEIPKSFTSYGGKDDTSMAQYKYFFIEGIDNNIPGYHLQLGNPYKWQSWNKSFYRCYSLRERLHYYFDGYTIKTPVDHSNSGNPLDADGNEVPTTDYVLTPSDVDAMVDGY